jgi:transcriptional regulator with PAS, ATPase and Fis domain
MDAISATSRLRGQIVLDDAGRIAFCDGVGATSEFRSLVGDANWVDQARRRHLAAAEVDGERFIIVVATIESKLLLLISRAPSDLVFEFIASVDFAYDILHHILTDPFNAMTVVDAEGRLAFLSPVHEGFFGLKHGEAVGRRVDEVIENTRLHQVVRTGKAEIGDVQIMRGSERVVSRIPIRRNGTVVGAIGRVMFKGREQVQDLARRISALEREIEFYRRETTALKRPSYATDSIIGESKAIGELRKQIAKVAPLEMPVLILGDSGTGKELVAHALHRLSPRANEKLVTVNAAALPPTLVESELFGYEAGSFSGADKKGRRGKFEQADNGTIFLDEIGDMPLEVQAKLLRVVQDGMVERVGTDRPRKVNFRLISATNHDLNALVQEGRFRLDLFYRVSPIILRVPSLSDRLEDIPLLVQHFVREIADRHGRLVPKIDDGVLKYLVNLPWPGNVRQLRHEVERAFVFAEHDQLMLQDFPRFDRASTPVDAEPEDLEAVEAPTPDGNLETSLKQYEEDLIKGAMSQFKGNKKRVARELGISRSYLYKRLKEIGLQ